MIYVRFNRHYDKQNTTENGQYEMCRKRVEKNKDEVEAKAVTGWKLACCYLS